MNELSRFIGLLAVTPEYNVNNINDINIRFFIASSLL